MRFVELDRRSHGISMQTEESETVRIDYAKRWFVVGCAVCLTGIAIAVFLSAISKEDFTTLFWLFVGASFAVLLLMFPLPCIFTHHVAYETYLRLRMGLVMRVDIPYLAMRSVSRAGIPKGFLSVGVGVRFKAKTGTVYVLSSFDNVIALKLREELKLRAWRPPICEIILSVADAEETIDLISRKIASVEG